MFYRLFVYVFCFGFSPIGALANTTSPEPISLSHYAKQLVEFHYQRGWDTDNHTVRSELNAKGKPSSSRVYNVAISRLIYGLVYASRYDEDYLSKAQNLANFQLEQLVNAEAGEPVFYSYWSPAQVDHSSSVDVWQQAYGLCGLVELYRNSQDKELLKHIHKLHGSFVGRFYDTEHGGFWGAVDLARGAEQGSKSLQSAMYPLTAYMLNLWLADTENRTSYEPYILSSLEVVSTKAWQPNWVNVSFSDSWQPCDSDTADCPNVTPGHNFQVAALLLRAAKLPFVDEQKRAKYQEQGMQLLEQTLQSNIAFPEGIAKGFVSEVNPIKGFATDTRRTWWQHAEALLALSIVPEEFGDERRALADMYFSKFWDAANGGEYFYLSSALEPDQEEAKGSVGKSVYHSIEAIRFMEGR